jgi:hypothetical protein
MKRTLVLVVSVLVCAFQLPAVAALWTVGKAGDSILYDVAYGQSRYVAVGESGTILTSTNASTWTVATYAGTPNQLYAVAYGNGTFVAVGQGGWTVTSLDGVKWTSAGSGATVEDLNAIILAAGEFVAAGKNGAIITSATGTSWTLASYATGTSDTNDNLTAIAYANGRFLVVGIDPGVSFTSASGTPSGPKAGDLTTGSIWSPWLTATAFSRR